MTTDTQAPMIDDPVHARRWWTLAVLCLSLAQARGSLGGALQGGSRLDAGGRFITAAQDSFVDALSIGLRMSTVIILGAAFVAWRSLPARTGDCSNAAAVPIAAGED